MGDDERGEDEFRWRGRVYVFVPQAREETGRRQEVEGESIIMSSSRRRLKRGEGRVYVFIGS